MQCTKSTPSVAGTGSRPPSTSPLYSGDVRAIPKWEFLCNVPSAPAQALAGVCARSAVTPLCGPRRRHRGGSQWRASPALVSGQEGRLVYGPRRPADARDQHTAGSGPQRYRPAPLHDEGVPSSRWQSTGVGHGARPPVQPGPLSASRHPCRPMWGGSRRRNSPNGHLVPQPPNPDLQRGSLSGDTPYHEIRGSVEFPVAIAPGNFLGMFMVGGPASKIAP